jgi:hypothetical protein
MIATNAYSKKTPKGDFTWDNITEDDWNVIQDSSKNIFDAAMIFEKIESDDRKMGNKKCFYVIYRRIRILNEVGRNQGDVEVPFLSISQKIKEILGRTVLPDGTIIELEKSHIFKKEAIKSEDVEFDQYTFSLPGVTDDCIIEYMIKYQTENNLYNAWIIQKDITLLKGEYSWKYYTGEHGRSLAFTMSIFGRGTPNYLWLNCGPDKSATSLPSIKDATETYFEISNVPPFEEEPHMFPDVSLKAKLLCYYGTDDTPAAFWGYRAGRIKDRADLFCKKNKKVKKIIESFGELETESEKIEAAYKWVQENIINLAYDEIYDKKNKKKESEDNKSVNDVIKRGYGTRTDINRVYYDMLREMNIDAKMAYAVKRSEDILIYEAKYWQFDASFVAVPDDQTGFIFYIPSYKFTVPGTVPWFFEGAHAIVGGASTNFSAIPFTGPTFSNGNRICDLKINQDYEVSGTMETHFTGHNARRTRIYLEDNDTTEYEILLQERFEEKFDGAVLDSFRIENYTNIDEPLIITCDIEYPDVEVQSNRILLKPFNYLSNADNPFHAQDREQAILFKHSFQLRESAQIELPEGWSVEALPGDTVYANIAGECGVQFTNLGNILNVQRYFVLNSPFWRIEQYPIIKSLFQTRKDFSDLIIVLTTAK